MSLLLETLKLHNRRFQNILYHNLRLNSARKELFGCNDVLDIARQVVVPNELGEGIYKCSVIYNSNIIETKFELYKKREIRKLKLVIADEFEYSYKYAERSGLNKYLEQKGDCDEVLFLKNGLVTDTSFSNIVFYDGVKWVTPKTHLLKGTKREQLLSEQKISETLIKAEDIKQYKKASLINCMLDLGDIIIDTSNIIF